MSDKEIKMSDAVRDENGFCYHDELPKDWCEYTTISEMKAWFRNRGYNLDSSLMQDELTEEHEAMIGYMDGEYCCKKWEPVKPCSLSVLMSIFDTEEGPAAWWATPINAFELLDETILHQQDVIDELKQALLVTNLELCAAIEEINHQRKKSINSTTETEPGYWDMEKVHTNQVLLSKLNGGK